MSKEDFHPLAPPKERDRYDTQFSYDTRYFPLMLVLGPLAVILLGVVLFALGLAGLPPL